MFVIFLFRPKLLPQMFQRLNNNRKSSFSFKYQRCFFIKKTVFVMLFQAIDSHRCRLNIKRNSDALYSFLFWISLQFRNWSIAELSILEPGKHDYMLVSTIPMFRLATFDG